jgi:hypothetical protein
MKWTWFCLCFHSHSFPFYIKIKPIETKLIPTLDILEIDSCVFKSVQVSSIFCRFVQKIKNKRKALKWKCELRYTKMITTDLKIEYCLTSNKKIYLTFPGCKSTIWLALHSACDCALWEKILREKTARNPRKFIYLLLTNMNLSNIIQHNAHARKGKFADLL